MYLKELKNIYAGKKLLDMLHDSFGDHLIFTEKKKNLHPHTLMILPIYKSIYRSVLQSNLKIFCFVLDPKWDSSQSFSLYWYNKNLSEIMLN